jgi:hypothetical protein
MSAIVHIANQLHVQWFCLKQNIVETTTFGSEYIVAHQDMKDKMDHRYTLHMMGIPVDGPAWIYRDNQRIFNSSTPSICNKRHNAL